MQHKWKRWALPIGCACLVLIGTVAWVSALLPTPTEPSPSPMAKAPIVQRRLGVWDGRVALFEGENAEPIEVYEVVVATLPPEEQQRLQNGIPVESDDRLSELLENYTS